MKRVMVSGSFDPPTLGHLALMKQCAALFDEVVVCLFRNVDKRALFSVEDRLSMLRAMAEEAGLSSVRVDASDGYAADYAKSHDIGFVVRGLRDERDAAYEIEMARYNNKRSPGLETLLWVAPYEEREISSTEVRKKLLAGEDASGLLPAAVLRIARECLSVDS